MKKRKSLEDTTQVTRGNEKTYIKQEKIDYREAIRKKLAFLIPKDLDLVIDYYDGFFNTFNSILEVSKLLKLNKINFNKTDDQNLINLLNLAPIKHDSLIFSSEDYFASSSLEKSAKRFLELFETNVEEIVGKCLVDICYEIKYQNTSLQEVDYKNFPKFDKLKETYQDLFGRFEVEYKNLYYKLGVDDANYIIDIILDAQFKSEEEKTTHDCECSKYLRAIYVKRIIYVKNALLEKNRLLNGRNCCSCSCVVF
jgi:hypothetical protein